MFGIGGGTTSAIGGIVIGFLTGSPVSGLVIGVVLGMVVLVVFAFQAVKVAAAGNTVSNPNRPLSTAPSTASVRDDAFAEARRIAQRVQPDSGDERLREEIQRLRDENERLRAENEQYASQPDADQLKERCLRLSQELFRFVDERDELNPQKNPEQNPGIWNRSKKETAHDEATMAVYARQFAGRVRAALDVTDRRGWITSVERKALEDKLTGSGTYQSPEPRIREMAQRLAAIGHRL